MVCQCGDHGKWRGFLSSTLRTSRDEDAGKFSVKSPCAPELPGRIPECLPLSRHTAITCGNAKKERVIINEMFDFKNGVVGFRRGVHFC